MPKHAVGRGDEGTFQRGERDPCFSGITSSDHFEGFCITFYGTAFHPLP